MRLSATDWLEGDFSPNEAERFVSAAMAEGIDDVCVSSGGMTPERAPPAIAPGLQVHFAERVRSKTNIVTRAVDMIVDRHRVESILTEANTDMVALARALLDDPWWAWRAADALGVSSMAFCPPQDERARADLWPDAEVRPLLSAAAASLVAKPGHDGQNRLS
jgi:2,4-dienoyl-CoA reductase-like NADH-dependent reductase (Old Yellow Enzyme family)